MLGDRYTQANLCQMLHLVDEAVAGRVAICQDFDVKALPRK